MRERRLLVVECAPEMLTVRPQDLEAARSDLYEHKLHYWSHSEVLPTLMATLAGDEMVLTENAIVWHVAVELGMPVRVLVDSRDQEGDREILSSQLGMRVLSAEELDIDWTEDSVENWQTLFVDGTMSNSVVTGLCERLCCFFDELQPRSRSPIELRVDNNLGLFEFSSLIDPRDESWGWRWFALLKGCNDEVVPIVSWNGNPYGDLPGAFE